MRGEANGRICGGIRCPHTPHREERRGERVNLCPADARRGGRENLRRDTPPAHTASGGAARRTVEFVAGYAAHVPGGTASGKTDAAGSRGRIPTSGEGTDNQIPPSGSSRAGLAVCARIYVRIDPAALPPHAVLPAPAPGDNDRSPGYAENLPFSRRRWRGAGISANYFVICVVKTTEFGFSETKISVRCAAADGFTRCSRRGRQTEKSRADEERAFS